VFVCNQPVKVLRTLNVAKTKWSSILPLGVSAYFVVSRNGVPVVSIRFRGKMNSFFGLLAGGLLSLFGRRPNNPGLDELKRADFPTSTQRMGIRFGEKIRDVFRFKWLKVARGTSAGHYSGSEQNRESDRIKRMEDVD